MNEVKVPAPYPRQRAIFPLSPWSIKCDAIDEAVALIANPDAFAQAVADETQLVEGGHAHLHKPRRKFLEEEGGCPAFIGVYNAGCPANVICKLTPVQLHGYVEEKLCHFNRNYYCPIWRARGEDD